MEKNWNYQEFEESDQLVELITALDVSKTIGELLINRGIDTFEKAKTFFRPNLEDLHNPFLMKGMNEAVNRIQDAINNQENILIYGDYDVDGTTSVALMYQYLRNFTENLHYYIPDRYKEGYGVSNIGVDFAIDNNFSLVIALDCGIKAVEKVEKAKKNQVDFIICDHHTPGEILPDAIILNPKQKGCDYPFKELCGCGVGFKLAQALNDSFALPFSEIEHLLDLVMVAIGADMVSVMGENRILAYHGLKKLNAAPRIGFSVLLELAGKQPPLTVTDVVFTLAPRINAAGRIESGNKAVQLLLATSILEAQEIGKEINQYNTTRRLIEKEITEEALKMLAGDPNTQESFATVLYNEKWHKGVVGIVASRIIEKYYKPTIVLTEANGMAVGSVRSVENINVYDALLECEEFIEQFGGHMYAAGLTLKIENIDDFRKAFNEAVKVQSKAKRKLPKIAVEAEIEFRDIFLGEQTSIPKFYRILKQFAPFGPDNMKPIFRTNVVRPNMEPKILKEAHLKVQLIQDDIAINAIGFNFQDQFQYLHEKVFNVVYHLEENNWNGNSALQLVLKDLKPYS